MEAHGVKWPVFALHDPDVVDYSSVPRRPEKCGVRHDLLPVQVTLVVGDKAGVTECNGRSRNQSDSVQVKHLSIQFKLEAVAMDLAHKK